MTAAAIIEQALLNGVMLSTDGQNIKLAASRQPSAELLDSLKRSKQQVIDELKCLQSQWLERVANALQRPPEWLLQHGIIDADDMRELWHTEPRDAAKTAKTGLNWHLAKH
jgi:hypothetical protein